MGFKEPCAWALPARGDAGGDTGALSAWGWPEASSFCLNLSQLLLGCSRDSAALCLMQLFSLTHLNTWLRCPQPLSLRSPSPCLCQVFFPLSRCRAASGSYNSIQELLFAQRRRRLPFCSQTCMLIKLSAAEKRLPGDSAC